MIVKRNIILFILTLVFIIVNIALTSVVVVNKNEHIKILESEHKDVNEKYITAQILSQQLDQVYNIFENNLSYGSKDKLNEEASMDFLKDLTDIIEKNGIKLIQIIPGKRIKSGTLYKVPYDIEIQCDYEEFGKFILALESNDRIIIINSIYLKNNIEKIKLADLDDQKLLDQKIEMEIYTVTLNKAKNL